MTKLIVSSDRYLIKNREIKNLMCLEVQQYIRNGNRLLLTTKRSLDNLYDVNQSDPVFVPSLHPLKYCGFDYTDISCLNGSFLYEKFNEINKLVKMEEIDPAIVKMLLEFSRRFKEATSLAITSDNFFCNPDVAGKVPIGQVEFNICHTKNPKQTKNELNRLMKKINRSNPELVLRRAGESWYNDNYVVKSKDANIKKHIEHLMRTHDISETDVLNLDTAPKSDIQRKIKDFMSYK